MKNKQKIFIYLGSLTFFPLSVMVISCHYPRTKKSQVIGNALFKNKLMLNNLLVEFVSDQGGAAHTKSKIKSMITKYDGSDFELQAKLFFKETITQMIEKNNDQIKDNLKIILTNDSILSWLNFKKTTITKRLKNLQPKSFGIINPKNPYILYLAKIPIKDSGGQFLEFQFIKYFSATQLKTQIGETLNNLNRGIVDPDSVKNQSTTNQTIIFNQKELGDLKRLAKIYLDSKNNASASQAARTANKAHYVAQLDLLANAITEQIINKQKEVTSINNQIAVEYENNIDDILKLTLNPKTDVIKQKILSSLKKISLEGFANYGDLNNKYKKTWNKNDAYILNISNELNSDTDVYDWEYKTYDDGISKGTLKWRKNSLKPIEFILVQSDQQQIEDIKNSFLSSKPLDGYVNKTLSKQRILSGVFDRLKNTLKKIQNKYENQNKEINFLFGSQKNSDIISGLKINSSTNKQDWIKKFLSIDSVLKTKLIPNSLTWNSYDIKQNNVYANFKIYLEKTTTDALGKTKRLLIAINSQHSIAKFKIDPTLKKILNNLSSINEIFTKPIVYVKPNWKKGENYTGKMSQRIIELVNKRIKSLLSTSTLNLGIFQIISKTLQVEIKEQINREQVLIEISFTYKSVKSSLYSGYAYVITK